MQKKTAATILCLSLAQLVTAGADLPGRMHLQDETLLLAIEDSSALYPLTVDPSFNQQAFMKASNTEANDNFGEAVAISGDTLVVGAWGEDSNATGVDGDQSNNSMGNAGAVYVFIRTGLVWSQQAYLKASNTGPGDNFGVSVAISGDTLVVGARGEDSNAPGVNGNQANNIALDAGAAYVFTRTNGVWSQQAYLKASNPEFIDRFGSAVAVSGDTIVVGADHEDSNATGVDGDEDNNLADNAGAIYVFTRSENVWSQQAYLKASNTEAGDVFGSSVAISADTLVTGTLAEESNATGINGDETNNDAESAGAVYVFTRTGSNWSQQAYVKASNTEAHDWFGHSVSISGDTLVVGAPRESSNATGAGGNESNNLAPSAGAAYVFTRTGSDWGQQAYLKASNTETNDYLGESVAISENTLVVGAAREDSNAMGVDGDQSDNQAHDSGAAYVFKRTAGTWRQAAYLKASNTGDSDGFGRPVAISGNEVIVGAPQEDSDATGIDDDGANDLAVASGAVYVFPDDTVFSDGFEGGQ